MDCEQLKVDNKKSTKTEHEKYLSKEYTRALSLLYSPSVKSAEELWLMLQIEIAKQNRPKRTRLQTQQRRPKRRKTNAAICENTCSTSKKNTRENEASGREVDVACNTETSFEEIASRDDIPTISIPDEDQNDGAVCKVCNFPEIGSLTLTKCDDCEKFYHQLCHQPPIVHVSLQEAQSPWHCVECAK